MDSVFEKADIVEQLYLYLKEESQTTTHGLAMTTCFEVFQNYILIIYENIHTHTKKSFLCRKFIFKAQPNLTPTEFQYKSQIVYLLI